MVHGAMSQNWDVRSGARQLSDTDLWQRFLTGTFSNCVESNRHTAAASSNGAHSIVKSARYNGQFTLLHVILVGWHKVKLLADWRCARTMLSANNFGQHLAL